MSIKEMSRVWEDSEQSGNALLLLLALADYADENGYCWPSIQTLAKKTRMSTRNVMRMINDLVSDKELYALKRRNIGNKYIVLSGCSAQECERRINLLSDKLSRYVTDCHLISDTTMSHDPSRNITLETPARVIQNPPEGTTRSSWVFVMYTLTFNEAVSPGEHDDLATLADTYERDDIREAMMATKSANARRRISRKVAYMRGILQDWARNGKPENVKQLPSEGTPARPSRIYR